MDAAAVNARLDEFEKTLGAIVPAIAQGAAVIRLVGGLVRGKMSPDQQKTFDETINAYDAQNAQLQGAVDRLRAVSASSDSGLTPRDPALGASSSSATTGDAGSGTSSNG
jgi:hypothetical protein